MKKLILILSLAYYLLSSIISVIAQPLDAVMVRDIDPTGNSDIGYLADVNGTLFFHAGDDLHGTELWKTDGTEAGTVLVKDVYSGPINSFPSELINVNGTLFFLAFSEGIGRELWKTDGTEAGTVLVKEINQDGIGPDPGWLTNLNGTLYFVADDGVSGAELWKSDGTEAGTELVKDIRTGASGSSPTALVNVNGTLFFYANDGVTGQELWKSDGTQTGTELVKDIRAGGNGAFSSLPPGATYIQLVKVNGELYFRAHDGINGQELWKSDGTEAGTVLVKNIATDSLNAWPDYLTNVNGTLFFTTANGSRGDLWKSDGTEAGTVLVKDIHNQLIFPPLDRLTNVNGTLFFRVNNGVHGHELWKSDGTSTGTVLVKDIYPGNSPVIGNPPFSGNPSGLINVNGTLFFTATDFLNNYELWMSDGTQEGTTQVKDIRPGSDGSGCAWKTNVNGTLFCWANDGVHGQELWKTTLPITNFNDVLPSSFGFRFIEDFFGAQATAGCGAGIYCPHDPITRAQVALLINKAKQGAAYTPPMAVGIFDDVPVSHPFADWIEQLFNEEISNGCELDKFCPNDVVTRAQMAVYVVKAMRGPGFSPPIASGQFTDVPVTDPFAPWVEQLANDGITSGCEIDNFCPNEIVTRVQMATFMVKAFNLGFVPFDINNI